jgi:hypothetical protein
MYRYYYLYIYKFIFTFQRSMPERMQSPTVAQCSSWIDHLAALSLNWSCDHHFAAAVWGDIMSRVAWRCCIQKTTILSKSTNPSPESIRTKQKWIKVRKPREMQESIRKWKTTDMLKNQ